MELQTKIPLQKQNHDLIDYKATVWLIGSCFAEHIGQKLAYYKFQNEINPLGILFHPIAISNVIRRVADNHNFSERDLFFAKEQWHCFEAHSNCSHASKEHVLRTLNGQLEQTRRYLSKASHVIISLGTAWIYKHSKSNKLVANCHKVSQNEFQKSVSSVTEVTETLHDIVSLLKQINDDITIIFTVSPVRHLKDGFLENTRSKSHLISAVHSVVEAHGHVCYFPAYELVMDELRDYRFYDQDMVHPNAIAIDYIWNKFNHVWMAPTIEQTMKEVDAVQKGLQHKPFNETSLSHQQFKQQLQLKISTLQAQFEHMTF